MSILADLEKELNQATVEDIEDAATFLVPKGRYHAILESEDEVESQDGNPGIELTFVLIGGPKPGKQVRHTLYVNGKDEAKTKKCRDQLNLFRLRLGLAQRGPDGKIMSVPGKKEFSDVAGAECLLDVILEQWTNVEKGTSGETNRVKFCGIHSLNDEKARVGAFLGGEEAKKKIAAKRAQDDLSDIPV